jgi:hypothetical protein
MPGIIVVLKYHKPLFLFNRASENVSKPSVPRNCSWKIMSNDKKMLNLRGSAKIITRFVKMMAKIF